MTQLRAAARRSPEAALRHALASRGDHAAAREVAEWLAGEQVKRSRSSRPRSRAARRRWRRNLARQRSRA